MQTAGTTDTAVLIVASELKDPICHSDECQIGSFSSEATLCTVVCICKTEFISFLFDPCLVNQCSAESTLDGSIWRLKTILRTESINPLSPHDALKHNFTSQKTYLIFRQLGVLERRLPWNCFTNTWQFSFIFKPHLVIFIHYKSRIATAIHGL